jgi:predicted nucleic acid binding AN1-type Zn finger protein
MSEDQTKVNLTKKKTVRCEHPDCKKKLGLLGFDCRCGHHFCGEHRMAENHACTYDYKTDGRKELLKYMSSPVIGAKIAVI